MRRVRVFVEFDYSGESSDGKLVERLGDFIDHTYGSDSNVISLKPDEVIGNLKDFTEAAQKAAVELKQKNTETFERNSEHNYRCVAELSKGFSEAICKLDDFANVIGGKKFFRFVERLRKVYENYGISL